MRPENYPPVPPTAQPDVRPDWGATDVSEPSEVSIPDPATLSSARYSGNGWQRPAPLALRVADWAFELYGRYESHGLYTLYASGMSWTIYNLTRCLQAGHIQFARRGTRRADPCSRILRLFPPTPQIRIPLLPFPLPAERCAAGKKAVRERLYRLMRRPVHNATCAAAKAANVRNPQPQEQS